MKIQVKKLISITLLVSLVTIITLTDLTELNAAFKVSGWSARATGMGGAYTAVSDDSSGILYNPAGIAIAENIETNLMYTSLFYGLDGVELELKYGAFIVPIKGIGTIGANWANFTSVAQYREDTVTFAYANKVNGFIEKIFKIKLFPELSYGINVKYLKHEYKLDKRTRVDPVFEDDNSQYAISVDAGLLLKPFPTSQPGLTAGLVIKNINQPDIGLKSKDEIPLEVRYGMAYKLKTLGVVNNLLGSFDISYRNQDWGADKDKINIHVGAECWFFNELIGVRLGGNKNEYTSGLSFNTPSKLNLNVRLDYGFMYPIYIQESAGTHRISLTYKF